MCCEGAKKKTAKLINQKYDCCLKIIGERRAEGGIRALRHHSCFDPVAEDSIPTYRPLFFWDDADKKQYKEHYGYQQLGRLVDMVKNVLCGDMGLIGLGAAQTTSTGKIADSAKIGRNASTILTIENKTPQEISQDGIECGNKKLRVVLNRNGEQMSSNEYIDLQFNGNLVSYKQAAKQHDPNAPY